MTFEEWYEKNLDRETNDSSLGPPGAITDTEILVYEKGAAKAGWNAALNEILHATMIHDTLEDIKTECNTLKTDE